MSAKAVSALTSKRPARMVRASRCGRWKPSSGRTARTQRFYAPVGEATRFGTLEITVGDCLVNVPEAPPESVAYLTIIDHKPGQAAEKLFAGWMFASTPSLSALDHGVYDVRVLACTMAQGSSPPSSR